MKKLIPSKKIKKEAKKVTASKPRKKQASKKVLSESSVQLIGLHNLTRPLGSHKGKRILGRGTSSGHGKTSTRGSKGQTSRAGRDFYLGFEGGQTPLIRRIPKRGFSNKRFKKYYQIVNIKDLTEIKDSLITPEILAGLGIIRDSARPVKILGDGQIKNPVTVRAHAFSASAKDKIKNAGGKIELAHV
jgi:large subunit ribosomal protein L15